jgi:hypothetical protein
VKRWQSTSVPVSLTGKIKTIEQISFLRKLVGIRVVQHVPTVTPSEYDEGTVETETSGEFSHPDDVEQFDLYSGATESATNIEVWDGSNLQPIGTVKDAAIDATYRPVRETIAKYHYQYRSVYRDKIEAMLYGVDYNIFDLFSYDSMTLRPSRLEYDLWENQTKLTAVNIT